VLRHPPAPTGAALAGHPGSLPAYVAEWFAGGVPCVVRYALGGCVHWHVNAAAEQAWALRLDCTQPRSPGGGLYPEGDWLPRTRLFGSFLRLPQVQLVLAQLLAQVFGQLTMAAGEGAQAWAGARHAAADVPLPLPLGESARRGVVRTYSVRCRLVTHGEHSWAASVFLPPSVAPPAALPLPLPLPCTNPPPMIWAEGAIGAAIDTLELQLGDDELLQLAGIEQDTDLAQLEQLLGGHAPYCTQPPPPSPRATAAGNAAAVRWQSEQDAVRLVDDLFDDLTADLVDAAGTQCSGRPYDPHAPRCMHAAPAVPVS